MVEKKIVGVGNGLCRGKNSNGYPRLKREDVNKPSYEVIIFEDVSTEVICDCYMKNGECRLVDNQPVKCFRKSYGND